MSHTKPQVVYIIILDMFLGNIIICTKWNCYLYEKNIDLFLWFKLNEIVLSIYIKLTYIICHLMKKIIILTVLLTSLL